MIQSHVELSVIIELLFLHPPFKIKEQQKLDVSDDKVNENDSL